MPAESGSASEQTLRLRDGRRLGFAEFGRPDGQPCLYFHGHPGSRLEAEVAHEPAASAGFRVIALDRPGYGLSDFEPARTILAWSRDVEAVGALCGLAGVVGWSAPVSRSYPLPS